MAKSTAQLTRIMERLEARLKILETLVLEHNQRIIDFSVDMVDVGEKDDDDEADIGYIRPGFKTPKELEEELRLLKKSKKSKPKTKKPRKKR